jgi:hypothetical protein
MFSSLFSRRKGIFIKKALPVFLAFCFVVALLSGCAGGGSGDGSIIFGTWTASNMGGDGYTITNGTIIYDDGGHGYDWAGTIVGHSDFTSPAGILYVQYTIYSNDSTFIGKINAVYWKNLTPGSVEMGNAINSDFSNPAVSTIGEAVTKFTLDNVGTWITYWGPYIK